MTYDDMVAIVAGILAAPEYAGLDADGCFAKLHEQPILGVRGDTIPKVVMAADILALVPPAELQAISGMTGGLVSFLSEINSPDNAARLLYFDSLQRLAVISADTYAAVSAELTATVPNPSGGIPDYGPSPANLLFTEGHPFAGATIPTARQAARDQDATASYHIGQVPHWLVEDALASGGA